MNLRKKISYLGMYLAVLAGSMTYAVVIVWGVTKIIPLEVDHQRIFLGVTYLLVVFFAVRFYVPKLRRIW